MCGDGICVNVEGCAACPQDCGPCDDATEQDDVLDQDLGETPQTPTTGDSVGCSLTAPGLPPINLHLLLALLLGAIACLRRLGR